MPNTILFVDDDIRVISALQRTLYRDYRVEIASGPKDALEAIAENEYAVVVSDLKMPGMDGVHFLAEVKRISPETIRILLTGQADRDAAIGAVNEGSVFRFLTKPCAKDVLTKTLDAALEQFRLVTSERELLQETLMGTVGVLVEILGTFHPAAFGRASRVRRVVHRLAEELHTLQLWEFDVAALLAQIGCISVPPATLEKYYAGAELTREELSALESHPAVGRKLLSRIPRLEAVALIIERQQDGYSDDGELEPQQEHIALGAQILRVAQDFDRLQSGGVPTETALASMRERASQYNPMVLAALEAASLVSGSDAEPALPLQGMTMPGGRTGEESLFRPISAQVLRSLRD